MVSILDNKKIAELVIEKPETEEGYEKINPESLATIIYENHDEEPGVITDTVQQHIDNKRIHLTAADVTEQTKNCLTPEKILPGDNITITPDTENNTVTISTIFEDTSEFLTRDSLVPEDETITLTPIKNTDNKMYIRANVPDVSNFLVSTNIIAKDKTVEIERDSISNNVYIKSVPINYEAGDGLAIVNGVITNTMPDRVIGLIPGDNIDISGSYPNFTISGTNILKVFPWESNKKYTYGDTILYNDGIYYCNVTETQKQVFDPEEWTSIAEYKMIRKLMVTSQPTQIIDLRQLGFINPITDNDTLIINVGGIIAISDTYRIRKPIELYGEDEEGDIIEFINEPIPANTPVEIMVLSNTILNSLDPTANINDWETYTLYSVGNIVIYDNALYKCIERHASGETFDYTKWHILMNYTKNVYPFVFEEDITSITLPETEEIDSKENISINVGNTVLLNTSYSIDDDKRTILLNEPIKAGTNIEVTVYTHGVLSVPMVPNPNNRKDMFLISNETGTTYVMISKEDLLRKIGLYSLTQLNSKNGNLIGVNDSGTDYQFYTENQLAAKVKLRNTTNGFNILNSSDVIENPSSNMVIFDEGSTLSEDNSVLLNTFSGETENKNIIAKNISALWEYGSNKGSLLVPHNESNYRDVLWNSETDPDIMNISNDREVQLRITATPGKSADREGWKAMDEFQTSGNGWLANSKTGHWQYAHTKPIKVTEFKFIKPTEATAKELILDLWVSNDSGSDFNTKEKIFVKEHVVITENDSQITVVIPDPIYARVFGFDIRNRLGDSSIGALHVGFKGYVSGALPSDDEGFIYVIGKESGNYVDIATSYIDLQTLNQSELEDILPPEFTKYKQIGSYVIENQQITEIYPIEDINKFYVNRNFVSKEEMTQKVEEEVENALETIGVYSKSDIDNMMLAEETRATTAENNRVIKTSEENKIYGTDELGNQTTYNLDSFTPVKDVKIGTESLVTNNVAILNTMANESTSNYYTKNDVYTKTEINNKLNNYYKQSEIDSKFLTVNTELSKKMNTSDFDSKFDARIVFKTKNEGLPENPDSNTFYFIQA